MKKLLLPFFAFVIATLALSSCMFNVMDPEGEYMSRSYDVEPFENISISAGMELILTQDSTTSVKIDTYENFYKHINVEVIDNTLKLTKDIEVSFRNPKIKVYVNIAKLDEIEASSGSSINLNSGWTAEELEIDMSSGSSAYGNINLKRFDLSMSSGAEAQLEGTVEDFSIEASSGSSFRGFELQTINGRADLSSGSMAEINTSGSLYAEGSSGSTIRYKGTSDITIKTSSGASVNRVE